MSGAGKVSHKQIKAAYTPIPGAWAVFLVYKGRDNMAYRICIDAGHGGSDPGAVNGNMYESEAALMISFKLGKALSMAGCEVIYIRTNDSTVGLEERTAFANEKNVDYFISIHLNAATAKSAKGIETYAYRAGGKAYELAAVVQKELIKATGANDRGVKTANYYVLRHTAMPAILVETGFISNDAEADALFDDGYQTKIANAIAGAVADFLGLEGESVGKRYNYLTEIPAGEFRNAIKTLMNKGVIKNKDGQLDLSYDMLRMFVVNYRAGLYH